MTELENSKRVSLQATYTPAQPDVLEGVVMLVQIPFDQRNLVSSVNPTTVEMAYVKNNHKKLANHNNNNNNNTNKGPSRKEFLKAIHTIESVIPELNSPNPLANVARFSDINPNTLVSVIEDVIKFRKLQVDSAIKSLNSIFDLYKQSTLDHKAQLSPRQGVSEKQVKLEAQPQKRLSTVSSKDMKLKPLMDWSIENNLGDGAAAQILDLVEKLPVPADEMTVRSFEVMASVIYIDPGAMLEAFRKRMKVEPIGYLHLERLSFTPAGIERGELVYSVPLSPGEEVNISHKEWSNTSEEFQRIVTDFMENFSEEGVTEKSDLAQSSNSQQQHTDGYNLSVTASGGYGPVNITASAGYNASNSSNNSQQLARTHGMSITRKASARVTKEHKTSFKVASASGTEDQAVRKIKNPFPDRATRTDYYQLLRKWRVDLSRYGVRLTYDITIPEPGSDILTKIGEINDITKELNDEFKFPPGVDSTTPPKPGEVFLQKLDDITTGNYPLYAAKYNATIGKPSVGKTIHVTGGKTFPTPEESKNNALFDVISVENIDDDHEVESVDCTLNMQEWPDTHEKGIFTVKGFSPNIDRFPPGTEKIVGTITDLKGKSGQLKIFFRCQFYVSFNVHIDITTKLKQEAFEAWRLTAWNSIRDAVRSDYEAHRQILEKRLTQLNEELGITDPLSLRKIEREEVMKGVMRWLFGPTWKFTPPVIPPELYDKGTHAILDEQHIWENVTLHGEDIKFLHHAIEWENMLYMLYPYFWSYPTRWEEKKYLNHPDIMHKTFLKSGAARVVLTIRPGFEEAFVSFIESGTLLPNQSKRYLTIAQEMENYAKTNYPGIPTANPDSDPRPLLLPEQQKAWKEMQDIMKLLDAYFKDPKNNKTYPLTADPAKPTTTGLAALEAYTSSEIPKVPSIDPWQKNKYNYKCPGIHGDYDLISYGAKGEAGGGPALKQDGTPNENAFITSWAESSLIGTWYEYTPTSALDIAFNEILPNA